MTMQSRRKIIRLLALTGGFVAALALAGVLTFTNRSLAQNAPENTESLSEKEKDRPSAPDEKDRTQLTYAIPMVKAKFLREGDAVRWAGEPVGKVENIRRDVNAMALITVVIERNKLFARRSQMSGEEVDRHRRLQIRGIPLNTRITRQETDPGADEAEESAEKEEESGKVAYEDDKVTIREIADDVRQWTRQQLQESNWWSDEAQEKTAEALADAEWEAQSMAKDLRTALQEAWQQSKEQYNKALDNLAGELAEMEAWSEEQKFDERLEAESGKLAKRVERMRERIREFNEEQARRARETARDLIAESRLLRSQLESLDSGEMTEKLEKSMEELQRQLDSYTEAVKEGAQPSPTPSPAPEKTESSSN